MLTNEQTAWHSGFSMGLPVMLVDGRPTVARWSNSEEEYRAARQAAAIFDRSYLGRLRATGADVLDLLNRLSTNKVDALQPGRGARTVFTTNKGRIVDQVTMLRAPDHVLLGTSEGAIGPVAQWLDTYTITEDATFDDVSQQTVQFTVAGPKAQQLIGAAFGQVAHALESVSCTIVKGTGGDVFIARTDSLNMPTYEVIAPLDMATAVWERLVRTGQPMGALPAGEETLEAVRIETGVPRYGHEVTESHNPLEAELNDAISWNKGCYIGQEVVARLRTYHKVQRYLVRLALNTHEPPPQGARLLVDGKDAGFVTSAAKVPGQPGVRALAYLRTAFVKQGTVVQVELANGAFATGSVVWVPELPEEAMTPAQLLALAEEPEE